MPRYQLKGLLPAAEGSSFAFPTGATLAVAQTLNFDVQLMWTALVMEAGEGRYGPFTPSEIAAVAMAPLLDSQAFAALRTLRDMELVTEL